MNIQTAEDLFNDILFDALHAERQLVKALPRFAEKASHDQLEKAFRDHLEETKGHVNRLERVIELLDLEKETEVCEAMEGLLEEADEFMSEIDEGDLLDVALIAAAQKIEHYEIASYGTLCAIANGLGHTEVSTILHDTLEEEKGADEHLTVLAESRVNADGLRRAA